MADNPRLRFYFTAVLIAALSSVLSLLLLTLLDHRLDWAAVQHFDVALQSRVHALSDVQLTRLMLALTWIGSIKIFAAALAVAIVVMVLRDEGSDCHHAALLGGALAGAFVLNEALKQHFHRMRPQVPWSIGDEHTFSFPSGHSLFSVVLYGTLAYVASGREMSGGRRFGNVVFAMLMPLGIGFSRIYLGMHYPTDVAAGWVTGALWVVAVAAIDKAWDVRIQTRTRV